ncbi:small-conductance mechanosensitive channel [alpha proteobacterium U9-1i]|nr:small-conductance mechanosensitive channel [alpha proteobacterium U9-1i]
MTIANVTQAAVRDVESIAADPAQIWTRYGEHVIAAALNVVAAALILIVGLWVSSWAANAMRKLARTHPRIDDTLAAFFSWIVRYGLMGFVAIAVLNRFGVATTSIVAVVGAGALAIGLALQGTLSNVAAGVMLILFRPYRLGDYVELAGRTGTVEDVNLFTTELTTPQNLRIIMPNGLAWGAPMVNYTAHPRRRLDLEFGVAYDTDIDRAIAIVQEVLAAEEHILDEPAPQVNVSALGDFAVTLMVRAWVKTRDHLEMRYAVTKHVKQAFDLHGIVIPFPTNVNYELRGEPPGSPLPLEVAKKPKAGDVRGD